MNLYSSVEIEFKQPFEEVGLDFKNEYLKALKSFDGYNLELDERHQAIKGVLQRILDRYSETPAKTKGGRVSRVIAKILSFIIPYFKVKK